MDVHRIKTNANPVIDLHSIAWYLTKAFCHNWVKRINDVDDMALVLLITLVVNYYCTGRLVTTGINT